MVFWCSPTKSITHEIWPIILADLQNNVNATQATGLVRTTRPAPITPSPLLWYVEVSRKWVDVKDCTLSSVHVAIRPIQYFLEGILTRISLLICIAVTFTIPSNIAQCPTIGRCGMIHIRMRYVIVGPVGNSSFGLRNINCNLQCV